ncbi:MAG: hypothetical protein ACK4PR_06080, partial [Gammaproteobacteria bacterium]
ITDTVKINDADNYELQQNWSKFSKDMTSEDLITAIQEHLTHNDKLPVAMSMISGYLQDNQQDQAAMLKKIYENLSEFLRHDAKTPQGRSILHLFSMFKEPHSQQAAQLMETLFANFEYLHRNINNIKDNHNCTALHTAAYSNNKYAAAVLKKWNANHTLKNSYSEQSTAIDLAMIHEQFKPEQERHLVNVVTGKEKINIEPVPNLHNDKDQELEFVGSIYRLIHIKQYSAAATALREYLANKSYHYKINTLKHYFSKPEKKASWENFIGNANIQDDRQRNLFGIFACANYTSSDEARAALGLLDDLLKPMSPEARTEMFAHQDEFKSTAIGSALFSNSKYSPPLIALYVKHGAQVDKPEGPYNMKPAAQAAENIDRALGQEQINALNNEYDLQKFLAPDKQCVIS